MFLTEHFNADEKIATGDGAIEHWLYKKTAPEVNGGHPQQGPAVLIGSHIYITIHLDYQLSCFLLLLGLYWLPALTHLL